MGHYARGTRHVIPITRCPVHDERGNALAFRAGDAIAAAGIASGHEPAVKGIAVRAAAHREELMATLVLSADADRRLRAACRRFVDEARPSSFHVNVHPRGDAYIFGRTTRRIAGPDRLREEVAGTSFLISPTSFFQTNVRAAEVLVRLVSEAVPPRSRVLDLYAGAGLFALPLARLGHRVVAVEENRDSIADGEASQRLNGVDDEQCLFVASRAEDVLRAGGTRIDRRTALRGPFDVVIFDPPRSGCSPGVIEGIFGTVAPRLAIYVSCNPEALARDLRAIATFGYSFTSMQPVDMFPHTAHVETVVVLRSS